MASASTRCQIKLREIPCQATLAEIAHRLGRKALEEWAALAKADMLLAWYRKFIAKKFDGSPSTAESGVISSSSVIWTVALATGVQRFGRTKRVND